MKSKLSFVFLMVMALAGCAACPPATFNKITPANEVNGIKTYNDGSQRVVIQMLSNVKIVVANCLGDWLCAEMTLPEDRRMRFLDDSFEELDEKSGASIRTYKVLLISYFVTCRIDRAGKRMCSSSEESPTTKPVEIKSFSQSEHNGTKSQTYWKTFSPTLEFKGTSDIKGDINLPLINYVGKRVYELRIPINKRTDAATTLIKFPDVTIDGKPQNLPDIRVAKVEENLCRSSAW